MDLELATVPATRFQVRSERAQGGITVRLAPDDPDSVEIRFVDEKGADIDEGAQRKIERLLYREDFRRAFAGDIGDIGFPPRAMEYYTAALEHSVDAARLQRRGFKVVLDYSYGAVSFVMPNVLPKIGASVLGVNPYATTLGIATAGEDHDTRLKTMGDLVRTSGSDLGFVFDADGECATIVDDQGMTAHQRASAARPRPARERGRPRRAHRAAGFGRRRRRNGSPNAAGATITWTKLSAAHLMEVAGAGDVDFAASEEGGFIWPTFLPAYDAAATLVHLLDLLAAIDRPLSSVVAELPEPHIAHEAVPTPWEKKGTVMRGAIERAKDQRGRARRRREDHVSRRAGRSCCPIPNCP